MSGESRNVVVGMSGGVDSSVAALLLKQQGWQVTGVMLKLWAEEGFSRDNQCCSLESAENARLIAAKIGIPFYLLDSSEPFYKQVVLPFMETYLAGNTPNPCIYCNPMVRWSMLMKFVDGLGGGFIATGHYAAIKKDDMGKVHLFRGFDSKKDQSYVLSRLSQLQLSRTIFPLSEIEKTETRQIAEKFNLPSAHKPDSQDICFIGDGDYRGFLMRNCADRIHPGNIVDESGKVLGVHKGLPFYTIGQRKGICVAAEEPLYVIAKRLETNELVVGKHADLHYNRVFAEKVNWIQDEPPAKSFIADIQFRYKSKARKAEITVLPNSEIEILLNDDWNDAALGQTACLYTNSGEVLGSGIVSGTEEK